MPAVSVIIPTLNRPTSLAEAIASVQAQTLADWELLVVRNGNHPDTTALLQRVTAQDSRVQVLHCRRPGAAAVRNEGMRHAQGALLAFLDDDDLWAPEKLARQISWLRRNPECGWVYSFFQVMEDASSVERGAVVRSFGELFRGYFVGPSSVVVRRACADQAGLFNESPRLFGVEDIEWFLRLAKTAAFGCVPEPLAIRRLHADHTMERHARYLEHVIHVYRGLDLRGQQEVTGWDRLRKVARLHHDAALFYRAQGASRLAARHFWAAVRCYPAIGLYRAAGSPKGVWAIRELLGPWIDLAACLAPGMKS